MPQKQATAVWRGNLREGRGEVSTRDAVLKQVPLSYAQRFGAAPGASPEELIAAAHAGCYSMALASNLADQGYPPDQLTTHATVTVEIKGGDWTITHSHLRVEAQVPGISTHTFQDLARYAKEECPVSKALQRNVDISLDVALVPVAAQAQ